MLVSPGPCPLASSRDDRCICSPHSHPACRTGDPEAGGSATAIRKRRIPPAQLESVFAEGHTSRPCCGAPPDQSGCAPEGEGRVTSLITEELIVSRTHC